MGNLTIGMAIIFVLFQLFLDTQDDGLDEEVDSYFEKNIPLLINENQDLIADVFSPLVEALINIILAGFGNGSTPDAPPNSTPSS